MGDGGASPPPARAPKHSTQTPPPSLAPTVETCKSAHANHAHPSPLPARTEGLALDDRAKEEVHFGLPVALRGTGGVTAGSF